MDTERSNRTADELKSARIAGEGEVLGCVAANPVACMTCLNANGEAPWADKPTKSYCLAYLRERGARKPPDVYYDGADCEFYRKAT